MSHRTHVAPGSANGTLRRMASNGGTFTQTTVLTSIFYQAICLSPIVTSSRTFTTLQKERNGWSLSPDTGWELRLFSVIASWGSGLSDGASFPSLDLLRCTSLELTILLDSNTVPWWLHTSVNTATSVQKIFSTSRIARESSTRSTPPSTCLTPRTN